MQERFIGQAAHGPASKHPTLPLWFSRRALIQSSFPPNYNVAIKETPELKFLPAPTPKFVAPTTPPDQDVESMLFLKG